MNNSSEPTQQPLGPPLDESTEAQKAGTAETAPEATPARGKALLTFGLILIGAIVLMFAAHRYSKTEQGVANTKLEGTEGVGQVAPDFTLKDIHGNTFKLSDLKGKVVILDFWATWCGPCKIEIPWFTDMYNQYRNQGLEVVGVAMDEDGVEAVRPFYEEYKMNYRVVIGNDDVANQFGGIFGLPTTFIIDRDGKIVSKHMGLVSKSTFEDAVKGLL